MQVAARRSCSAATSHCCCVFFGAPCNRERRLSGRGAIQTASWSYLLLKLSTLRLVKRQLNSRSTRFQYLASSKGEFSGQKKLYRGVPGDTKARQDTCRAKHYLLHADFSARNRETSGFYVAARSFELTCWRCESRASTRARSASYQQPSQ